MNSKNSKYLVTDAKVLNKSASQVANTNKYPSSAVSKTVNGSGSTKDAKQAFFTSSTSTSNYKESGQKSYTTTTSKVTTSSWTTSAAAQGENKTFFKSTTSTSKYPPVTTSSWTTSAAVAAENKTFLKSTTPTTKYPPVENKYNSYSSINKEASSIPTSSIFYSFDKVGQRPFGGDVLANKYVSPYRGQPTQLNPYTAKSSSETAKWTEVKTNPALYKKPTATINSIQKPLGSLVLTTVAGAAILKNERDPQVKANINNASIPSHVQPSHVQPAQTISSTNSSYSSILSKAKKGYLVIYNQEEFKDKTMNRQGSRRDEEALCRTFYNYGMDPNVERNLKYNDFQNRVIKLSKKDFKNYGVFVAVFLSHGDKDEIVYSYDKPFNINHSFIHPIARNPTLNGKPKIFIIAACRGDQRNLHPEEKIYETDSVPFYDDGKKPYMSELLKCYSTYEGYVSYRDPTRGTVFIQTLCDILGKNGDKLSIEDILKEVNKTLTAGPQTNKQVPTVVSTMSEHFFFGDLKKK